MKLQDETHPAERTATRSGASPPKGGTPTASMESLIAALREKRIAGAVLDVFETEPLPPNNPLWDMPNVLVSPHSASTVEAENRRIVDLFIANLHRYLAGQTLINQYGRDRGY